MSTALQVSIPVSKDSVRTLKFETPIPHRVIHLYPKLSDYQARKFPDRNNPRSHDSESLVSSRISKEIKRTLEQDPESFKLRNKGGLVIAQSYSYDDREKIATVELIDHEIRYDDEGNEIRPLHGLADGGTTDKIIFELQNSDQYNDVLDKAQWHLEIVVFDDKTDDFDDPVKRETLSQISWARNTSQQVKGWSFKDLQGDWNWLKKVLDATYSKDLVAYEEYSGGKVTVLDILSILNLFRSYYSGSKAPTSSYSSKGTMLNKYEKSGKEFKVLTPVLIDILELHDYIYSRFDAAYKQGAPKRGLRRYAKEGEKVFVEHNPPIELNFSDNTSSLEIPRGLLFPVLASFRALLNFPDDQSDVNWFTDPKVFWDNHGTNLIERLITALVSHKHNPQTCGKDSNLYRNLYDAVNSIRRDEEMLKLEKMIKQLRK